ncbi:hypothetical protein CJ030_MR7G014403 [Morella rubra]|uniref:Protein kinase domain-containing protein n=1 Tax=Morella rubra TaxID=262757 RepID=A0A6A1V2N0_9ROSI|nr:hypothetical protein CJ030_MR7G014403 [Morella rubra]
MDVSLEMVISYFFLVVVFLVDLGDGQKYDCPELSCGSSGLPIRFPFRLNSQPEYLCGYPGFNLSCTHRNETVLELPNSVKLFVTRINYVSQVIQLTDAQHCLPGSLRGLDISSSPFQFTNVPDPDFGFDNSASLRLRDVGAIVGSFLLVLVVFAVVRVYRYDKIEKQNQAKINMFLEDYRNFKPTRYSYADIKRITSGFTEKLGQGTYGTVFKGQLSNEIHVAVKILNPSKGNGEEFINEVGTIGKIHHVNVVRLIGFCADGFRRALVYEFLPNNSLEKFIGSADTNNCFLGWEKLQDIAIGIAKGVEYLHQDVYSFGMLLLEIVGGRKNTGLTSEKSSQVYFPEWVYNLLEQKDDLRLYVEDDGDAEIAKKLAVVGLWCIQWHPMDRPSMKLVVQMLEGEGESVTMPPNPFTSSGLTRVKASMHPRRVNQELQVIPELE